MNDNIIMTNFVHNMKFDLKGHVRSRKALYVLKKSKIFILLKS